MAAGASTAISNARTREQWAAVINADWRKSMEGIVQTGRDLTDAKSELEPAEFAAMVQTDLFFGRNTAYRLINLASDPNIASVAPAQLPPSWSVLSELRHLSEDDFAEAVSSGLITPQTGKREARAIAGAYKAPEGATVGDPTKPAMLPSPKEARKIARATGRLVAASDNNIYSGATEEEGRDYRERRTAAFRIIEAIETLGDAPDAEQFFRNAEEHWFVEFRPKAIDDARAWLANFKTAMGVVDA